MLRPCPRCPRVSTAWPLLECYGRRQATRAATRRCSTQLHATSIGGQQRTQVAHSREAKGAMAWGILPHAAVRANRCLSSACCAQECSLAARERSRHRVPALGAERRPAGISRATLATKCVGPLRRCSSRRWRSGICDRDHGCLHCHRHGRAYNGGRSLGHHNSPRLRLAALNATPDAEAHD